MLRWEDKKTTMNMSSQYDVTISRVIMRTTTNTGKNQKKGRNERSKFRSHFNHNPFSEIFIYQPLGVFS